MDIKHIIHSQDDQPDGCSSVKRKFEGKDVVVKRRKSSYRDEDSDSDTFSRTSSRRSTVSSISPISDVSDDEMTNRWDGRKPPFDKSQIANKNEFFSYIRQNVDQAVDVKCLVFQDSNLPKVDSFAGINEEEESKVRQELINTIHDNYVHPLLDLTGYKWARKAIPGRGKGCNVFTIKYQCSQQKVHEKKQSDRSRQLSNPLKQYNCESMYLIKYTWSKQLIEISYSHANHAPYIRLPEEVKKVILRNLDRKASVLYKVILNDVKFRNIQHLIPFSKVQSYWSKERVKKKEHSDRETFKEFFNR